MSEHDHHHSHATDMLADHPDDHSHGGAGQYIAVFFALCILTAMSFFTYSSYWPFKDQKAVTYVFMLAISCTKAMLVIMFFMHLLWEANWKWVLTIPASLMSIFLLLMLIPDVGLRIDNGWAWYSRDRWLYAANPRPVEKQDVKELDKADPDTPPGEVQ
jgi:cytochrome c oxidase subunit 4